jgi:hypothetical protein
MSRPPPQIRAYTYTPTQKVGQGPVYTAQDAARDPPAHAQSPHQCVPSHLLNRYLINAVTCMDPRVIPEQFLAFNIGGASSLG